jgi:hypothetical protein
MDAKSPRSMRNIALGFSRSFETWERVAVYRHARLARLDPRTAEDRRSTFPVSSDIQFLPGNPLVDRFSEL